MRIAILTGILAFTLPLDAQQQATCSSPDTWTGYRYST